MTELYQRDDWRELKAHPAADVLPLMSDEERAGMVADMRQYGYRREHPVMVHQGLVIDGRNRLRSAAEAGIEPWFADYQGDDVVSFIVSVNLERRHLTPSQRAMVAVDLLPHFAAEAREKQRQAGMAQGGDRKSAAYENRLCPNSDKADLAAQNRPVRATEQAGKKVGVGRQMVDEARRIRLNAPDLAEEVKKGSKTVNGALLILKKRTGMNATVDQKRKEKDKAVKSKRPREMELEQWETMIEGKMEAFLDVAYALFDIRERRLYIDGHGEFTRYLKERWGVPFSDGRRAMCGIDALMQIGEKPRGER